MAGTQDRHRLAARRATVHCPRLRCPTRVSTPSTTLDFGSEKLAFGHLGQAHTDGDLYVHFTRANVLVAGGVVSSAGWPVLDWQTGGWIGGLVAAYDRLLKVRQ